MRARRSPLAGALVLIAVTATAPPAHADDKAAAEAAFLEAKELAKAGKWAEACPKFEISYHADPQLGALLNVADCHARIDHTATAWAEFREAEELAAKKGDARESYARDRATALESKLDKLRIDPPAAPLAGLTVRRDGADVTGILGTALPIDPGEHEIVVGAPGYSDWKTTVTIIGEGTMTPVTLEALVKLPDAVVAAPRDGSVDITTPPGAEISIDSQQVGVGHYTGKVKAGGHTLRVVATGMRVYQTEIVVEEGANRVIDVPLEPLLVVGDPDAYHGVALELGAAMLVGVKEHAANAAVIAYRFEIAWRPSWRVSFGGYAELGTIDASNACGFDLPGASVSPFDFGPHNRFTRCTYLMGGLQLVIHVLPRGRLDPYIGVMPGFRATFVGYIPVDPRGTSMPKVTDTWPGVMANGRIGVDYLPVMSRPDWKIGALFEAEVTVAGEESANGNTQHYATLFGGLRSTYAF